MKLKLIGNDSKNGIKILKELKKIEKSLDCQFNIEKISSKDKHKYNVKVIPTLYADDKLILSGNVLTDRELLRVLKPLLNNE